MQKRPKPLLLVVLDGWGYSETVQHNAIAQAKTPTWDRLWQQYPHRTIEGSGQCVGLPEGQMGNSEVGHLSLGSGRIIPQDFSRISNAIDDGSFFTNSTLVNTAKTTAKRGGAIHIFGLLSAGGVHSHERHIHAAIKLMQQHSPNKIYLHAFLDGRDTPPKSAMQSLQATDALFQELGCGYIASIIGRYYAMDRDQRWDRVQQAYELLTEAKANYSATSAELGLQQAYDRGETDEFVQATRIIPAQQDPVTVNDEDAVLFMNFRADRARQLTRAFTEPEFAGFERHHIPKLSHFVSLTEYAKDIHTEVAYPPMQFANVLGDYLAQHDLQQLRIAETEKYAHVTFFFNGGIEAPFPGEERILVPSPQVATYDLQPHMSAPELTDKLCSAIKDQRHDVIICNYANPDMVGHTGNFAATMTAIECIDACIARLVEALDLVGGEMLITADHGNAECMHNDVTQQAHTAHTSEPVPLLYYGQQGNFDASEGSLRDIAPTLLYLLDLPKPAEMTGTSLLK